MEATYVNNFSVKQDIEILFKTVGSVLKMNGAV